MVILQYMWQILAVGILLYLLCNVNFAIIFSKKIKHADIRSLGSGNPGTTNVVRNFGLKMGVLTFCCDLCKGILCAAIGKYVFFAIFKDMYLAEFCGYFFALAGILGHMFPVFLRFKGGKGVAASLGALIILNPIFTACALVFAAIIIILTDKVSIFALLNITAQFVYISIKYLSNSLMLENGVAIPITITMGIVWLTIIVAHRKNIVRLFQGKENNSGIKSSIFKKKTTKKQDTTEAEL